MRRPALAALLLALSVPATAQAPTVSGTLPARALDDAPHVVIDNGKVSALLYPPGEKSLYKGTRFDHAGVVLHITYKGQDYSDYWFDRFVVDPRDTSRHPDGTQTACCAVSGPVEEFGVVGFEEAGMGGRFLKPGVGIFKRDSDNANQHPTLPLLNAGTRSFKSTKAGADFTHDLHDRESGYGYRYRKSVALMPGKPQMTMAHEMTNTGSKPIVTTVYNHNFLTLSPGNEHLVVTAPFALKAEDKLQPALAKVDGKTVRYLASIPAGESVKSTITGFGSTPTDYDFTVTNSKTGFGQRIRGDQPITRIFMWSVPTTFSWEPYIAISLKPGETKRWTYTYNFYGPGEK
ncbi:MAG: hypothetical protein RL274_1641 [Pseudomonadota bacterium]|jgi:hypothetical protein